MLVLLEQGLKRPWFRPGLHSILGKSLKMGMMPPALPGSMGTKVKDNPLGVGWGEVNV